MSFSAGAAFSLAGSFLSSSPLSPLLLHLPLPPAAAAADASSFIT
eukprot:CAMPEP_0178718340 /NCGR_PEP_ID=MMETSP0699-20121125/22469_1 /TAXON_ID=265572 /ORGANISM="Extubocellulus spinifer, Strain CCMP396" /LENGTH=44 /DNA_ID= /DNA_START= /DNA_END= /DNA_ORIENTATION=